MSTASKNDDSLQRRSLLSFASVTESLSATWSDLLAAEGHYSTCLIYSQDGTFIPVELNVLMYINTCIGGRRRPLVVSVRTRSW